MLGLKETIARKNTSMYALARVLSETGTKNATSWAEEMSRWASGKIDPKLSNCILVADALGATLDELADRVVPTSPADLLLDAMPGAPGQRDRRTGPQERRRREGEQPKSA